MQGSAKDPDIAPFGPLGFEQLAVGKVHTGRDEQRPFWLFGGEKDVLDLRLAMEESLPADEWRFYPFIPNRYSFGVENTVVRCLQYGFQTFAFNDDLNLYRTEIREEHPDAYGRRLEFSTLILVIQRSYC